MTTDIRVQHIGLHTTRLDETRRFFEELLGVEPHRYDPDRGLLTFELADGFVIRFETDKTRSQRPIRFIGLELSNFEEVDAWYARLANKTSVVDDWRERFRHRRGPYGFLVDDPNGYTYKIFKYNEAE